MVAVHQIRIRVVGDRLVARSGGVDVIVGFFVRCPCCGEAVDFRSAPCRT